MRAGARERSAPMKIKGNPPKEDPATAAKRAVEEARAEADATAATQGLLTRRTKRVMRVFGKPVAGGFNAAAAGAGTSGSSGVVATPRTGTVSGGSRGGGFGRALGNIAQY